MTHTRRPDLPIALLAILAVAAVAVLALAAAVAFRFVIQPALAPKAAPTLPSPPTLEPISLSQGAVRVDLCQLVPAETMEAVMGRKLVASPAHFDYYNTPGASGCWYDVGADALQTAHFGYVVLTPLAAYTGQPLKNEAPVTGLGKSAYFNDGAQNARQLWVKIDENNALVVAFGDQPNEAGAQLIAQMVLDAIRP